MKSFLTQDLKAYKSIKHLTCSEQMDPLGNLMYNFPKNDPARIQFKQLRQEKSKFQNKLYKISEFIKKERLKQSDDVILNQDDMRKILNKLEKIVCNDE